MIFNVLDSPQVKKFVYLSHRSLFKYHNPHKPGVYMKLPEITKNGMSFNAFAMSDGYAPELLWVSPDSDVIELDTDEDDEINLKPV